MARKPEPMPLTEADRQAMAQSNRRTVPRGGQRRVWDDRWTCDLLLPTDEESADDGEMAAFLAECIDLRAEAS